MFIDTADYKSFTSSIPSSGTVASTDAMWVDGIYLVCTTFVSPGATRIHAQVAHNRESVYRDRWFFSAGIGDPEDPDSDFLAVEGTSDMQAWRSSGCPLPGDLELHRKIVVPLIEAAAEGDRLIETAKKDADRRRSTQPRAKVDLAKTTAKLSCGPIDDPVVAQVMSALNTP